MSDARQASGAGPARDAPPDLFAGPPDWDAPLPDLAEPADGSPLPDLGGDGTDDLWAPVPQALSLDVERPGGDGEVVDLTRPPRRTRRGRRRANDDPAPRDSGGPGRVAEAPAAAREHEPPSPAAETSSATGDEAHEPRGLATGGPIGGLEPGTLFGPPDAGAASADGPRVGERRRGRRKRGDDAAGDESAKECERPRTAEERLQHALKLAYQHLTKRDRTVSEVRTHLERRAVDEASIAGALAELVEFRYLDDERYAARFVEDKRRLEGWGHLRIAEGLRRTGIDRAIADRAVADDPLRDDEAELAVDALERRLGGRAPADDRARQKALRMLATKGYPLETAYAAVRAYERRCAERVGD